MRLRLTIDNSEAEGGSRSWKPLEDQDLPYRVPPEVTVGRFGELNVFACPTEPDHPYHWGIQ